MVDNYEIYVFVQLVILFDINNCCNHGQSKKNLTPGINIKYVIGQKVWISLKPINLNSYHDCNAKIPY